MTDASLPEPRHARSLKEVDARTNQRNRAETRFRAYGIAAVATGLVFLLVLLGAILFNGVGAFQQTFINVPVYLDPAKLDKNGERNIEDIKKVSTFGYNPLIEQALLDAVQESGAKTELDSAADMKKLLSASAAAQIRDTVIANPELIGQTVDFRLLAASRVDGYLKGRVQREDVTRDKNIDVTHLDLTDELHDAGIITKGFNMAFITGADASESRPEQAGLGVSMLGSFFMMLVVLGLSLPIGVAASIYLEEFAPEPLHRPDRGEYLEPRRGALDRVRHPGPCRLHPVCPPAAIRAAGGGADPDADDPAHDCHLDPCQPQIRAALDPRRGARGGGLQDAGGVPSRAAHGHARHPDRHDHRPRSGAWGNRTASADRDGGLYRHQPARRPRLGLPRSELGHARADIRMGQTRRPGLLRTRLGRHHHPSGLPHDHEYHRHHPAPPLRAPLVRPRGPTHV